MRCERREGSYAFNALAALDGTSAAGAGGRKEGESEEGCNGDAGEHCEYRFGVRAARQLRWDAGEVIERELQKSGTESLGFLYHLALGLGGRRRGRQQQVIAPAAAATTTSFQW